MTIIQLFTMTVSGEVMLAMERQQDGREVVYKLGLATTSAAMVVARSDNTTRRNSRSGQGFTHV